MAIPIAGPEVPDFPPSLAEALVGHYALERVLGRGGMATVFLARDLRHKRLVALKVLHPELAQFVGPERFRREIEVAAGLQHPNILTVLDSGEAGGHLWFTMPFVDGETLRSRLQREGPLPVDEALRLASQTADALHYAHVHGIIHRDIKPENLLLADGRLFVADFGLARPTSQEGFALTEAGMALGTPAYMSPEQVAGSRQLDARTDIYSLACVLYEMLAGDPPFAGRTAQGIMARHIADLPPRLRTVRRGVPDRIERVITQALAKVPADRFATAAQFAEAFNIPDVPGIGGKRRLLYLASATLLVALSVIAAWRWGTLQEGVQKRPETALTPLEHQRLAVLYFTPVGSDPDLPYVADGLSKGLIDSLRQIKPLDVVSSGGVAAYHASKRSRDSIAGELGVSSLVDGRVEKAGEIFRVTIWLVQGSSGVPSKPRVLEGTLADLLPLQQELAKTVVAMLREKPVKPGGRGDAWILVQRARQRMDRADSLARVHQIEGAQRELKAGDSLLASAEALDRAWGMPLLQRGQLAYKQSRLEFEVGDTTDRTHYVQRALALAESALMLKATDPDALELRGTVRYWNWLLNLEHDSLKKRLQLEGAQRDLEAAIAQNENQPGAWAVLSHLYNNTHGPQEAAVAARKAYETDPYQVGADKVLNRLFLNSYDLARFADAAQWCEEGARRFPADPNFVECRLWMMTTQASEPNVTLAWNLADSVRKLSPDKGRKYATLSVHMTVAMVLARAGLRDSARRVAHQARSNPEADPNRDLAYAETYVHILRKDKDHALEALRSYLAANPERRADMADTSNWWFHDIQNDKAFRALVANAPDKR